MTTAWATDRQKRVTRSCHEGIGKIYSVVYRENCHQPFRIRVPNHKVSITDPPKAYIFDLVLAESHFDVGGLEHVETGQHTSAGNTSKNISTGTLHQRHKTFV